MIRPENRFDDYAYRSGEFNLSAALIASGFEDGILVSLNSSGELIKATSLTGKAFTLTTSKKIGRDQVSGKVLAKGTILIGTHVLINDQVETVDAGGNPITYAPGTPLMVSANGKYVKSSGDSPVIVGYAMSGLMQEANGSFLRILTIA